MMTMLLAVLAFLLLHDTCHATPLVGLADISTSLRNDVHYPELRPYMKHLWRLQQGQAPHPLDHVIGILPHSVQQSEHGAAVAVFSDLDLMSEFDAVQLLFHGARCPDMVRVRVCTSVPCHSHKMSTALHKQIPQYYVAVLKDVNVVTDDGDSVPRLEVVLHMRSMYECRVKGLLLIQYSHTDEVVARVRRSASTTPPPPADPSLCHMEAWSTSIEEIGIDKIIAPNVLTVNQCVGNCTVKAEVYSNHAYIRHRYNYNKAEGSEGVNEPCCVPIKVKPLSLLLVNQQLNMQLTVYHDMVVEACGCI